MAPKEGYPSPYVPPGASRPVSYKNGVYMISGQDKGKLLRALLDKAGKNFRAIVFVDDKASHCARMEEAFAGTLVDLVTVRYSREDERVKRFDTGP
jgi:hypothetical protein